MRMNGPLSLALCISTQAFGAPATVEFNRDVRPILSDKCFGCHGPDATAKGIPLRLDREQTAKADLGGRRAIVEGDAGSSELIRRVTAGRKALLMPPVTSGHSLSAIEIDTLRRWIEQGAGWQQHWAFLAPRRPELPSVKNASWARNPIDRFVLARLEREGLAPSAAAEPETLIRRVALDLTGLPPSLEEIRRFLTDSSPKAYEKLVDRLLASPRFGERMAIRWLDAARYADTNGYQYDGERFMWRWRDWVIDAFNRNQPFDQFALEQIAGDILPGAAPAQKIATGFNRNHRANTEDGIIPEEYAVEYVVDRVETASAVFLGLTLGCARCHNHKYDPITQKEFYQVFAYFNNIPEMGRAMKYGNSPPLIPAPSKQQQAELDAIQAKIAAAEAELARSFSGRAQAGWERSLAGVPPVFWSPAPMRDASFTLDDDLPAHRGKPVVKQGRIGNGVALDGASWLEIPAAGQFDIDERFSLAGWFRSECEKDCSIVSRMTNSARGKGFGVHWNEAKLLVTMTSNWDDDAIRFTAEQKLERNRWYHIALTYTGSRMAEGFTLFLDGKPVKVNVLMDTLYRPFRNAGRAFSEPFRIGAGNGDDQRFRGLIDDVHIYSRVLEAEEIESLALGMPLNEIAAKGKSERTPAGQRQLRWYFLEHGAPERTRVAWRQLTALNQEKEKLERSFPTVMIMAESPVPKQTHLLLRGQYDKPGDRVAPGIPAVFPPLPAGAPNNRLGFARWVVDPGNPLTARVTVNRFWQMLFGTGLVRTVEDFGLQGEWPSHPDLLDWLAVEFMRTGWDVKALMKTIVLSATYRQSSKITAELIERDPENRLLARGARVRMPAEMVRDSALLAAGLLKERLGGPSVKPYQPEGLWQELVMQDMYYVQSKGDDLYRRSLYTFWKRTVAPPMMANFDSALRESCVVRESRTNTPLQALNLMNDVTFVEAGRFLGQRMILEGGATTAARLSHGFRLVTGRSPGAEEEQTLRANLQFHLDYFASKPERAKAYLSQGDSPPDSTIKLVELAAYAALGSLLLNLDEAITKE